MLKISENLSMGGYSSVEYNGGQINFQKLKIAHQEDLDEHRPWNHNCKSLDSSQS